MTEDWKQYVLLEISEAYGDPERLLEIQEALLQMYAADLMPDNVSTDVFNRLQDVAR